MRSRSLPALAFMALVVAAGAAGAQEFLPPGHRAEPHGLHALVGARVFISPGNVIDDATVLVRDGLIAGVGTDVEAPPGARVWQLEGATIYAGLIDCHLELGATGAAGGKGDHSRGVTAAGLRGGFAGVPGDEVDPGDPGPGASNKRVHPELRVATGVAPDGKRLAKLRELGFTAGCVVPQRGVFRGTSAVIALAEVDPNHSILRPDAFQHIAFEHGSWPDRAYPGSLMGTISLIRQTLMDAQHHALDRADYEVRPRARSRPAYNPSLQALQDVLAGRMRVVIESEGVITAHRAGRIAAEFQLDLVLLGNGEEWRRPDLVPVGTPIIVPLRFPKLPELPEESDWEQVSLDNLRRWDWAPQNAALLRERGHEIAFTTHGSAGLGSFREHLQLAIARGLSEADALAALTTSPARLLGLLDRIGTIEPGKIANLLIVDGGSYFDPQTKIREVWIDGRRFPTPPSSGKGDESGGADTATTRPTEAAEDEQAGAADREAPSEARRQLTARTPQEGRGPLATPRALLVQGATLWTSGPQETLSNADLLAVDGKIVAVGTDLGIPPELADASVTIDGTGLHVTPGLIDCHSHSMITGGVNEGTLPSSAMVSIGDVVNSETEHIYRQLAGGLTVANLLHGSANPIGGQNAVVKLRDGAGPEAMKVVGAPPGIKFALGENVKQSNWGEKHTTRFPQTRMGVKTFFDNRFLAARQYLKARERHAREGGPPLRRNLELDALGQILRGERLIHCHSYRQDEILMLIRLMEEYGVTVGTFQHVLEGYKVADEIAAHGAGGSCFTDWWAYKFEVYDAIPYDGALMHERGVVVSFNSDSSDLARRMNLEAAKAVRYGGVSEHEALQFVTLNPARQLGIDATVGSLEPGKDADLVVWSGSPLAASSRCLETWIDGKQFFNADADAARTQARIDERTALLAKARAESKSKEPVGEGAGEPEDDERDWRYFFEVALEHQYDHGVDIHCLGATLQGQEHNHEGDLR